MMLDNNLAENSMRPITLGRKNWIPHWKSTCRIESGRHTFSHRNLPTAEDLAARLSVGRASRLSRYTRAATACPYPNCLGRAGSVISRIHLRQACARSDAYYRSAVGKDWRVGAICDRTREPGNWRGGPKLQLAPRGCNRQTPSLRS